MFGLIAAFLFVVAFVVGLVVDAGALFLLVVGGLFFVALAVSSHSMLGRFGGRG